MLALVLDPDDHNYAYVAEAAGTVKRVNVDASVFDIISLVAPTLWSEHSALFARKMLVPGVLDKIDTDQLERMEMSHTHTDPLNRPLPVSRLALHVSTLARGIRPFMDVAGSPQIQTES